MVIYDSASIYIDKATTLKDKIARIDAIITALESTALKAAESGHVDSYELDDSQTKIKSSYRNPVEVANSIHAYEVIKQRYINQLNGRAIRLVDSRNFRRY